MNFIEASKILKTFTGGVQTRMLLSSSANIDPLILYVRAAGAVQGKEISIETLPFGTLGQTLLNPAPKDVQEVILLNPWDLLRESDWRSGIPAELDDPDRLLENAKVITTRLAKRKSIVLFLPAAMPPLFVNPLQNARLSAELNLLMATLGARFLDAKYFSLSNYLSSGLPFGGSFMGELAEEIIDAVSAKIQNPSKVLVTDLDNVLWSGLAAEDGIEGIACSPEGKGFRHFLYQTLLLKLKSNGVLLAAVSRNDLDVAKAPIINRKTQLSEKDFVEVLASYEPKSLHIKRLAQRLNLGIDSFVFVDDNPVELAEVSAALPEVKTVQFPLKDDQLPFFFNVITELFKKDVISEEDRQRTDMYRRRLEVTSAQPIDERGGDLRVFLTDLKMELSIFDRGRGDRERAVQLINKTNQFNLNGIRRTPEEVDLILSSGGKLFTIKMDDRTGSHGEILACLIDKDNCIQSFVLSCRVFQRQIEYAFVCSLLAWREGMLTLAYQETEKNTPIREFLKDTSFTYQAGTFRLDRDKFLQAHLDKLSIFKIQGVDFD